jgi:hypothetical protein
LLYIVPITPACVKPIFPFTVNFSIGFSVLIPNLLVTTAVSVLKPLYSTETSEIVPVLSVVIVGDTNSPVPKPET